MVYKEVQRFNQWWLKALLWGGVILPFIIAISDGNELSSEDLTVSVIVAIIAYLMLFVLKLETIIDEEGIHYRFFPFHLSIQTRLWSEIECAYIRVYHPLAEFGGWGVRSSFGQGQALNIPEMWVYKSSFGMGSYC